MTSYAADAPGASRWTGQNGQKRDALLQLVEQRGYWIRVCGADHPDTLRMQHIQAQTRCELGDLHRARKEMRIEWIARAGHVQTGLAELRYLEADLAGVVEDGHPEMTQVAALITKLS